MDLKGFLEIVEDPNYRFLREETKIRIAEEFLGTSVVEKTNNLLTEVGEASETDVPRGHRSSYSSGSYS